MIIKLSDGAVLDMDKQSSDEGQTFITILVHDMDIKNIVEELKEAGAAAISINDILLNAPSVIAANGPLIYVDGNPCSHPYTIKAIGDPDALESRINAGYGYVKKWRNAGLTF